MTGKDSAVEIAKKACETMMNRFDAAELPPAGLFHYHQGVFLSGMMNIWKVCGERKYYDYTKAWVDSIIDENGGINTYDPTRLDDIQPGILLFKLYKDTGEKKYKIVLDKFMDILKHWQCNEVGGFWHKEIHPNQMWLDSLYMAGPIQAEYASEFNRPEFLETAIEQALLMDKYIKNPRTGLLHQGWDYSKAALWSDPETGISPECWGRAMGWYVVAVLDILEFTPQNHPQYGKLVEIERNALNAVMKYQDENTGMWYQIVDKGDRSDNWLESSCTSLFSYAIAHAVHMGIIDDVNIKMAWKAFDGIMKSFVTYNDGNFGLGGVCIGTSICDDYDTYISRPVITNDLHGIGAFLLMCSELAK